MSSSKRRRHADCLDGVNGGGKAVMDTVDRFTVVQFALEKAANGISQQGR